MGPETADKNLNYYAGRVGRSPLPWFRLPHLIKEEMEDTTELVKVRNVRDMSDEIFIKHLMHRHSADFKNWNLEQIKHFSKGWSNPWRAFHDNLHKHSIPGQYDHVHSERR